MDQDVKDKVMQHLKPLVNVIYTKGQYYIYQADSLLKEPGLTADLAAKTSVDRYFVTSQIKSIAMKASEVVNNTKLIELEKAYKEANMDCNKHKNEEKPEDSDESLELEPVAQESKFEVGLFQEKNLGFIPFQVSYQLSIYLILNITIQGVVLNTGDVIRLGRVCYIVKENSIDLSEKAIKMLESYAKDKHDTAWEQISKLG